jgi:hypothetical protein
MNKNVKKLVLRICVFVLILYAVDFVLELLRISNILPGLNSIWLYYSIGMMIFTGIVVGLGGMSFAIYTLVTNAKKSIIDENIIEMSSAAKEKI